MITAENIMGVHRNYSSVGKCHKILILIRIIVEIVVYVGVFCKNFIVFSPTIKLNENVTLMLVLYHLAFLLNGVSIIICAVQSSHSYELFMDNFMAVQYCFWNVDIDKKYIRYFKIVFLTASSTYSIANVILITLRVILLHLDETYIALLLIEIYVEIRYILESVIFSTYISILQCYLNSMNMRICDIKAQYTVLEKSQNSHMSQENDLLTKAQVNEWATKYKRLESCSKSLSECFKIQVIISIT